jgi:glycosyltransferase involved in cell wall biosynthesis
MNDKSLVSVIIPTYKRPGMLGRAIESVLNQTYDNIEIIVVDDNDEDSEYRKETEEFMKKYLHYDNLTYLKHKSNKGACAARNKGYSLCNGYYVAFLDDDDFWHKDKIFKTINCFENKGDKFGVCFSSYYVIKENKKILSDKPIKEGNIYKEELFKDYVSSTSAVVIKRKCLDKVGVFDLKLPARQDYDLWIRISEYFKFAYIDLPLTFIYREKKESISTRNLNPYIGTKIVLEKIISRLDEFSEKYKKKVISRQNYKLGILACGFGEFKQARIHFKESLKIKFKFKTLIIYIIILFFPTFWRKLKIINNFMKNIFNRKFI